jgi:hypothetical protein
MTISWSVAVDWDGDGSFTTAGDNITAYVMQAEVRIGIGSAMDATASVGTCTLIVKNADRRFSPLNTSGAYYGKLLPRKSVRVQATDGSTTWTVFRGYTQKIKPTSGQYLDRVCTIECVDVIAILQGHGLDMPLQIGVTGDFLIKTVVNFALGAPAATATITLGSNPANNNSVTINGTAYTFKAVLSGAADQVLIGAANTDTAQNLTDAINTAAGIGTTYGSGTTKHATVSAEVSSNVVTLTALLPGVVGNAYTLAKVGAAITRSGATFSGGADYPTSPAPSYQAGKQTFSYAGDTWQGESTDTRTAIDDVTRSEYGLFWVARDGTINWKNYEYLFLRVGATPVLTLNSEAYIDGEETDEEIYNSVAGAIYAHAPHYHQGWWQNPTA